MGREAAAGKGSSDAVLYKSAAWQLGVAGRDAGGAHCWDAKRCVQVVANVI